MDNHLIPYLERPALTNSYFNRDFNFSFPLIYSPPEIPETAIARINPSLSIDVLKKQEREESYKVGILSATTVANSYVNSLSSQRRSKIRDINVSIRRETPSLLRRILTGEKEVVEIDIDVR
ncbi:MAG: hypothetical protein QXX68_01210 [Candidatus Pacearchaeota archaeon]